jgi:hypothetical protein
MPAIAKTTPAICAHPDRGRILHHIDDAHRATQQAIADALR